MVEVRFDTGSGAAAAFLGVEGSYPRFAV